MAKIVLDEELVKHIASLSRISLTPSQLPAFEKNLNEILNYAETVDEIKKVEDVGYLLKGQKCLLREDVVKPGLTQEEALSNAPKTEHGYFRVDGSLAESEDL